MMSTKQKIGFSGELWAYEALTKLGYTVTIPPDFSEECHDLTIDDRLCCEVKRANQKTRKRQLKTKVSEYPRWQWDVSAVTGKDCVLILIAVDDQGIHHPFIMPAWVMADRSNFEINSHPHDYRGFIASFLGAWEVVEFMLSAQIKKSENITMWRLMSDDNK